jgi:hypothetical protein
VFRHLATIAVSLVVGAIAVAGLTACGGGGSTTATKSTAEQRTYRYPTKARNILLDEYKKHRLSDGPCIIREAEAELSYSQFQHEAKSVTS